MDPTRAGRNPLLEQHLLAGCDRLCPFPTCFPVSREQIKTLEARGGEKGNQELFVLLSSQRQVEFPLGQFEPLPAQEMLLSLWYLLPFPGHGEGPWRELCSI